MQMRHGKGGGVLCVGLDLSVTASLWQKNSSGTASWLGKHRNGEVVEMAHLG